MAFTEDLSVFLSSADFAVSVKSGATTGLGILDMTSEIIADGVVLSTDFKLTCESSKFGSLLHGEKVTVDGTIYTVRSASLVDDGAFVEVMLMKD
ncbi:MAG: hypothetical protein VW831_10585 [Gammaproteobacteria bacterium]